MIWDIGCNTGDYAKAALASGAGYAVGFDFDQGALDAAFARAESERLELPAAVPRPRQPDPEPGLGRARAARADRAGPRPTPYSALALVHHLAIGRNVPLEQVVAWLVGLAPNGMVEFVPKSDPMVQRLLRLREDIFDDYSEETFAQHLQARAKIVEVVDVSATGRRLFWFARPERARSSSAPMGQILTFDAGR